MQIGQVGEDHRSAPEGGAPEEGGPGPRASPGSVGPAGGSGPSAPGARALPCSAHSRQRRSRAPQEPGENVSSQLIRAQQEKGTISGVGDLDELTIRKPDKCPHPRSVLLEPALETIDESDRVHEGLADPSTVVEDVHSHRRRV